MNTMETLRAMRPQVEPFDPAWSATTLQQIERRGRRKRKVATAVGASVLVIATGGTAAASGGIPDFVNQTLDWISSSQTAEPEALAAFSFEDGGRTREFEMWTSINADGEQCTVLNETTARFGPGTGLDGSCTVAPADGWFGWLYEGAKTGEPAPDPVLYVYGEAASEAAVEVRVTGDGFEHTFPVRQGSRGFAGAIPEVRLYDHGEMAGRIIATLYFLDTSGDVVRTKSLIER